MTIVMYIKDKAVHLLIHLIMVLLVILMMLAFQLNQAFILFIITMIVFFISICFLGKTYQNTDMLQNNHQYDILQ